MAEVIYSLRDLVQAISDGVRSDDFFVGRIKTMRDADILPVGARTSGGQARYTNDARIAAAIYNILFDWGLSHSAKLPEAERNRNPSRSAFWAVADALDVHSDGLTFDFIKNAARQGEHWLLRVDHIPQKKTGLPTYMARAYPMARASFGETPERATSTLSVGLTPLIAHLVGEA